jgi:hypothetical protein
MGSHGSVTLLYLGSTTIYLGSTTIAIPTLRVGALVATHSEHVEGGLRGD